MKRPARQTKRKYITNKHHTQSALKSLVQFFLMVPAIVLLLTGGSLFTSQAHAASGINKQINFQGKLVDNNGLNVADNTYTVVFSLYNVSSGGSATWTETDSVSTSNGVFQVALGAGTPFPGNVDFNSDTWYLGIKVGADAEMTPRIRFSAVPYAFNAAALDGIVATNSATQFTITGGTNALIDLTVNGSLTLGSTIKPTASGGLTVQSNGANGLTLDTGGAAALAIGATANSITFGATNNPTYSFNGTGAVTFQGTSFTLGNGSTATIQTSSNAGLNILSSGSGNITLGQNAGNGGVIVQPNAGGNAALIINKQADLGVIDPNIFVASAAGVLKFAVDEGGNATAAASLDVGQPTLGFANAVGNFSGNLNNYLQVQVQNKSNGNTASSDFIATADNGTDTTNYIDFGINGSGYNQASFNIGSADDGYLYTSNGALTIGTASNKPLIFHTNGTTSSSEALRIDALGKVGVGTVGTSGAGNGQFVVNQTNNSGLGDIFSASAAGATKFTISNTGAITDGNYAGANAILFAAPTTGLVTTTTTTTGSQCLLSSTGSTGTPVWGGCGGASASLQTAYNVGQSIDLSQAGTGLTFGTGAGTQNVVIAPNAGGQAGLVVNDQGLGPILTASASGSTVLVLSHTGNLGIASSNPQQALTLGATGNFVTEMAVPSGATATIVTGGSLAKTSYFYKITASDGTGETIGSTETSACTSTGSTNTCNVSWTAVANAVSYKIYRTSTSGSYTGTNFLTSVTTTSYSDTGAVTLTSGTPPTATTAYVTKFSPSGNSWLLGGNVGIGTSSPIAPLDIEDGSNGGNAALIINQTGSATNNIFVASAAGVLKFAVDSGGNATAAASLNVGQPSLGFANAVGNFAGNINNYLQVQVQNKSNGTAASTDFIATADNGTDTTNYIDFGINGSGYNQASFNIGSADDGYLYTSNGALTIGTASNKPLIFHTNGTTSSNEAMRIDALGKVTIGVIGGNGNGQFIVNQTNNSGLGDIISASASGATKFVVGNTGLVSLIGGLTADIDTIGTANTLKIGTSNQNGLTIGRSASSTTVNGSSVVLGAATSVSGALTVTSNSATALTVGANGSTNPVLIVNASTGSVATGLQVLGAATGGTTALSVTDSGTNANLSVDAKGSGSITIGGTSTGSIIIGGSTNGLTFSTASGPSYAGTGRPTKQIVLSAEYPGAVLTASGSAAISGNMTSDASSSAVTTTANNYENYYMWTATALGSDQQYTVAVRVTLPKDFSDWATGNAITVDFNTPFTNSALNSLDVFIYKGGDTTGKPVAFSKGNVSSVSKNWGQVAFTKAQLTSVTPTLTAAGQQAVFYLTFHSTNTVNYVQVGDITLNYLAAF